MIMQLQYLARSKSFSSGDSITRTKLRWLSVRDGICTFPSSWLDFPWRCSWALSLSLSPILCLSLSFCLRFSLRVLLASSFLYIHAILTQVFEWEGIIKRRTSNGGIRRNLIFRTKSIDSPIGRAFTTLSTEKAREREHEDDAPKNSSYSGIRRPPRPND